MCGVHATRCVRHHGTRRIAGEGESAARARAGDSGSDTGGSNDDGVGADDDGVGAVLLDLPDLHSLQSPQSR
ncbi:hypothetical protein ACFX13_016558 [Malus domestica]